MAVPIISGTVGQGGTNAIQSAELVVEMEDKIFLLEPNKTPLTLLMNQVSRRAVGRSKFEWLEDERTPEFTLLTAASLAADTTLDVTTGEGAYADVDWTIRNQRTGELCYVSSIAGDVWTVIRGYGSTVAADMNSGDAITILGGAARQGADLGNLRATKTIPHFNLTEIVRDPFGVSRTLLNSNTYGGNKLAYLQRARAIEHAIKLELKAWFSERSVDNTGGADDLNTMGGMDELIGLGPAGQTVNFSGTFTLADLFDTAQVGFRYGSMTRMLFLAPGPTSAVSTLAVNALRRVPEDRTFGISIKELITPHGRWLVTKHNLFTGVEYAALGYSIDLSNVGWRFLRNSDTKLYTNIQIPGADRRTDEFLTEAGIVRMQDRTHMKLEAMV